MTRIHKHSFFSNDAANFKEVIQKAIGEIVRDMDIPRDPQEYCPHESIMNGDLFTIQGRAWPDSKGGISGEIQVRIIEKEGTEL